MKYISEIITEKEIREWKNGDIITIAAGTGAGKSYFVKNELSKYAKHMLILVPRSNLKDQFIKDIKELKNVEISTYQKIESMYKKDKKIDLSQYDYIIADEYDYFQNDSSFSDYTDISFKEIIKSKAIKIFMSATGNDIKSLIENYYGLNIKEYNININNNKNIERIKYFNSDDTLKSLAEEVILKNEKAIFFIESAKKCYETYLMFKDNSLFNCSSSNKDYCKYVNDNKIQSLLENEKFEENILFTTCCMNSGVSIKDKEVKYVILDVKDINSLIQCAGRKRSIDLKDSYELLIKNRNSFELSNMLKSLEIQAEKPTYLFNNGQEAYESKYKRNYNSRYIYIENGQLKVNVMMLSNNINNQIKIQDMIKKGYIKYVNRLFNKRKGIILEDAKKGDIMNEYLESIVGKKLFKEEQEELKKVFMNNGLKARTMGINTLNGYLKDIKLNYDIIAKKSNNKRYWTIIGDIDR